MPRMVPGSRVWDAEGHAWCRVVGPGGSVLVDDRHNHCPVHLPGGAHRQARAV